MSQPSNGRWWIMWGGLLGAMAVAWGAYSAHGLENVLRAWGLDELELARRHGHAETAARYQMFHALALLAIAALAPTRPTRWWNVAGCAFVIGVLLFAGSLVAIVFTGQAVWGRITPFGGVCLLWGWIAVGCGSLAVPP